MRRLRKNNKGFTMLEILAVVVILGLLMAVAIPGVTKYVETSRRKTLMASIRAYIEATAIEVNNGDVYIDDEDTIYAIPVECVALESGGENPFGEWSEANDEYWAYVLVKYDGDDTYTHTYGFTFRDSSGYGMYPITENEMSVDGSEIGVNLIMSRPKTGTYTYVAREDRWGEGFEVIDPTTGNVKTLKVFQADDEEESEYKCKIYRKGKNHDELAGKFNTDFSILKKNEQKDVSETNSCGANKETKEEPFKSFGDEASYLNCYGGNNGQLKKDEYGGIVLGENYPIVYINKKENIDDIYNSNAFSINLTVKAKANQYPQTIGGYNGGTWAGTIVAIGNAKSDRFLGWIGFYKGNLHVYTYTNNSTNDVEKRAGFAKISLKKDKDGNIVRDPDAEEMYNIQITSEKTIGKEKRYTNVYINGEYMGNFESGNKDIIPTQVTIGDLRPYRNLKFNGTIYEIEIYNRKISDTEININYQRATEIWGDTVGTFKN